MVAKVFYGCPIDYKDILTLDLNTRNIKIGRCDHFFGYMITSLDSVNEDDIYPDQFRIKSWHVGGRTYGVCTSFEYVIRNEKELEKILKKLLNYPVDQIIYFICDDTCDYITERHIVDIVKSVTEDMLADYKIGSEGDNLGFNTKIIIVKGVLNKVTIYLR